MIRLAHRFVYFALALAACMAPAAWGQTATAAPAGVVLAVRNFAPESYQANRQNWAAVEDNRGIFYFSNTSGVLEFDGTRWRLIKLPNGAIPAALGKAPDGRILVGSSGEIGWLAPDQNGVMTYVPNAIALPQEFHDSGDRVVQILNTPQGQVYLADHWLFIRSNSGALSTFRAEDHFMQAAWFHGALYVIDSTRGLTQFDGTNLQNVAGGAHTRALAMLPTDSGLIIPSYNDGLVRYQPDAANPWQVLNSHSWSPSDSADVTSGLVVNNNLLALGTAHHGVTLINADGAVLQQVGPAQGLNDSHIYNLNYDHRGGLWAALDNGVSLIGLNVSRDAAATPFHSYVRGVVGSQDERLLFGGTYYATVGGLQQLLQSKLQWLKFPFRYNAFRFEFSGNGLTANSGMEFQSYMEGVDKDWTVWSSRSEREFTELPAGKWTFRVRARRAGGEVSDESSYYFVILPPWYNTWWFALIQLVLVLVLLHLPHHAHQNPVLQDAMTTFAVIVPFIYLGNALGGFINRYYPSNVGILNILFSSLLAFMLDPLQNILKREVEHRNARLAARKLARQTKHMSQ